MHSTERTVEVQRQSNADQQKANLRALKSQVKALRRQSRQAQAQFFRSERKTAYARFLSRDRVLRVIEYEWRDDIGSAQQVAPSVDQRALAAYAAFSEARIQVQLVANCLPREAAKNLGDLHLDLIRDFRTNSPAADADIDAVETASGLFLARARRDLRRAGKRTPADACSAGGS